MAERILTSEAQAALEKAQTVDWSPPPTSTALASLRFMDRAGVLFLQQEWYCTNGHGGAWREWRDVPIETE